MSAEELEAAADWSDYRAAYGVSADETIRAREYRAFMAGWVAGRHGEQSSVQR